MAAAPKQDGELNDDALDKVSGGAPTMPSPDVTYVCIDCGFTWGSDGDSTFSNCPICGSSNLTQL